MLETIIFQKGYYYNLEDQTFNIHKNILKVIYNLIIIEEFILDVF